jgi:hypothetical protein
VPCSGSFKGAGHAHPGKRVSAVGDRGGEPEIRDEMRLRIAIDDDVEAELPLYSPTGPSDAATVMSNPAWIVPGVSAK